MFIRSDNAIYQLPEEAVEPLLERWYRPLFEARVRHYHAAEPDLDGNAIQRLAWVDVEGAIREAAQLLYLDDALITQELTGVPCFDNIVADVNRQAVRPHDGDFFSKLSDLIRARAMGVFAEALPSEVTHTRVEQFARSVRIAWVYHPLAHHGLRQREQRARDDGRDPTQELHRAIVHNTYLVLRNFHGPHAWRPGNGKGVTTLDGLHPEQMAGTDVLAMIKSQVINSTLADLEGNPPPDDDRAFGTVPLDQAESLTVLSRHEDQAAECAELLALTEPVPLVSPIDTSALKGKARTLVDAIIAWQSERPDEKLNIAAFCRETGRDYEATVKAWKRARPHLKPR